MTFTTDSSSLFLTLGTPVNCHGLNNAVHDLNGKLGDVGEYNEEIDQYKVLFEDKALNPVQVKRVNQRIILDLPDTGQE